MLPSSERLLQEIRRHEGVKTRDLAKIFEVQDSEFDDLVTLLSDFQESGQLVRVPESGWVLPERAPYRVGLLKVTRRGHGFVELLRPEHAGDIFIPPKAIAGGFDGDLVLVEIERRRHRGARRPERRGRAGKAPRVEARLREGRVVDIVRRSRGLIRGQYQAARARCNKKGREKEPGFVIPFKNPTAKIYIPPGSEAEAQDGQRVLVRLVEGRGYGIYPVGEVVHTSGEEGSLEADFQEIAAEFGFPVEQPESALEEAARLPDLSREKAREGREDLRHLLAITIDPEDARDFDDAVSLERLEGGGYRLGVHIADVSHYVPSGSALDRSARERGTSIYLPGRVVPMLPERLANDLASLRPDQDRLTKTALMDFDAAGRLVNYRLFRSLIHNRRRFTYEEVLAILEEVDRRGGAARSGTAGESPRLPPGDYRDYLEVLNQMAELRDLLHRRRLERGALELDIARARLTVDGAGEVVKIAQDRRDPSHHLIEEFMLAANEAVAAFFGSHGLPLISRVHNEPDEESLEEFFYFLEKIEPKLVGRSRKKGSTGLQAIAAGVRGAPYAPIVHLELLRSLPHAEYAAEAGLHFALATSTYCHFTSPIRRYPDLLVHQVLDEHWGGRLKGARRKIEWAEDLPRCAVESSHAERRAEEAEREMTRLRIIRHLKSRVGEEMAGMVTGIHPFGFFVQVEGLLIDGLVHLSTLVDDYYEYDPEDFCLKGCRRRRAIRLGQRVRVVLSELDADMREIRFHFLGIIE
ncbi:MAG: VacB/RNase II family 3'-5' exoribonuclease [Planctomycetes bacterium]|nr:VacB/RNase II family 3'-5' exoribonuclease [Planctomycetota bacterium]